MINMNNIQMGAKSELIVSVDLLDNGYYVFRSVSPSSPFDLVCFKNGIHFKIEVKTGTSGVNSVNYTTNKNIKYADIIAVYNKDSKEIIYLSSKGYSTEDRCVLDMSDDVFSIKQKLKKELFNCYHGLSTSEQRYNIYEKTTKTKD